MAIPNPTQKYSFTDSVISSRKTGESATATIYSQFQYISWDRPVSPPQAMQNIFRFILNKTWLKCITTFYLNFNWKVLKDFLKFCWQSRLESLILALNLLFILFMESMLCQKGQIIDRFLFQQFIDFILQRFIVRILNARIEQHHFALCQCQYTVSQSNNHFAVRSWHWFAEILCKTAATFDIRIDRWRNPDETIVAQYHRCTARQIMEMCFASFD